MNLHIHLCVLTKQIPTSCILYAIDSRGVHGSGGSGFACRFVNRWHQFRVRTKPNGKHRKTAKINKISLNLAKIWWGFHQIQWFFPQIVPKIAGSGVSMPDLIVLVVEICQIKLKNRWNRWRICQNLMSLGGSNFMGFEGGD